MKLRIVLATVLTVFTVMKSQGQIYYTESEDLEDVEALYLGYENKISFNIFEGVANLSSKNAKITSVVNDPNSFIIVVESKDSVELEWTSSYTDGSGTNIVKNRSKKIPVRHLPKLEVCLGNKINGTLLDVNDLTLKYCYSEDVPKVFMKNATISKWIVSISGKNKSYNGSGNVLSDETIIAIKSAKKKSTITISTISNDGKVVNGTFKK